MATTDYNAELDVPFVREFAKYLPKKLREWLENAPECAIGSGIIQRDRMMEIALAEQSNGELTVVSKDAYDFSDGSDMKTVTVNRAPDNMKRYKFGRIIIPGVKNKIGNLRVVVYDPGSDKFRYIVIWKWGSDQSAINISNNPDTESKYLNGQCGIELDSFKELAEWKEIKLDEYNPNLFLEKVNFEKLIQYDNLERVVVDQPIIGQSEERILEEFFYLSK